MNVLFLITKAGVGGAQGFLANLIKGLKNKENEDIKISLASGSEGKYLEKFSEKENISFFRFENLKRNFDILSLFKFILNFSSFIKKNNFDIIHLNSSNTLSVAFLIKLIKPRTKIIFTVHGLSVLDPNYKTSASKKFFYNIFFKLSFRFVDEIVFVSENNLNFFLSRNKKTRSKSHLIYNAVETSFLDREEARPIILDRTGFQEGDYLMVSIGRLAYPKNYEFLIENFSEVLKIKPEAKLILIGDGPKKEEYEKKIKEKRLEGKIFLWGEEKNASRYLKAFDLFVLTSIYEGLSISLIEALFSGIKIIASRVGGNEEIIGKNNCYILNDRESFQETFKRILNSEQKDYTDYREKFNMNKMVYSYISIYNKNSFYDKGKRI